jgi:hypothetical protein
MIFMQWMRILCRPIHLAHQQCGLHIQSTNHTHHPQFHIIFDGAFSSIISTTPDAIIDRLFPTTERLYVDHFVNPNNHYTFESFREPDPQTPHTDKSKGRHPERRYLDCLFHTTLDTIAEELPTTLGTFDSTTSSAYKGAIPSSEGATIASKGATLPRKGANPYHTSTTTPTQSPKKSNPNILTQSAYGATNAKGNQQASFSNINPGYAPMAPNSTTVSRKPMPP